MVIKGFSYNLITLFFIALFLGTPLLGINGEENYNEDQEQQEYYEDLDEYYYEESCPPLTTMVKYGVRLAFRNDSSIAASLLRLHFHDCFVNGCDGSILLDDTRRVKGEKNSLPNRNSVRGYEVIESIKAEIENECPYTVSCTDILALAAREAVSLVGGPYWPVVLGRRDGYSASEKAANENLPSPFEDLDVIIKKFVKNGLDLKDVVVLSGAHTIGYAQCVQFKGRLFNHKESGKPDPSLNPYYLSDLKTRCPDVEESNNKLVSLDYKTTYKFDNVYYKNVLNYAGLLDSDQALMGNPDTLKLVQAFSTNPNLYAKEFGASMVKLGKIGVLKGENGQVRKTCGVVNY